ncbi:MAG TPA: CoA-binding protein [Roseiflexaceae bacterium]|nr:CoA-binding protein [Roseiflexaceae bacterium]
MTTATPPAQPSLAERVADFLAQKRIAVCGVSNKREVPANLICRKLQGAGYSVFPVSPTAASFDGSACYPDLTSIPDGADGVVIVTQPDVTEALVRQCAAAGVRRVWMHQSFAGSGTSVSAEAVQFCRDNGISVIDGACPMMFCEPVDIGHRCIHWLLKATGGLPH